MRKNILILVGLIVLVSPVFSRGQNEKEVKIITYSFMDASVPPEYHRSYDITLTEEGIRLSIDSYGEILLEETFPFPSGVSFNDFSTILEDYHFKSKKVGRKGEECTGGTGEAVKIVYAEGQDFYGYAYHCGGEPFGSLRGDTDEFSKVLRSLIPDFSGLMESTESEE